MDKKKVYGVVYLITNLINGKQYVGQTIKKVSYRFNEHARANTLIGKAIRKYGRENFKIKVLEKCYSYDELNAAEMKWIKKLNTKDPNGYNKTDGGEGILNPATSTREKLAQAGMGNKHALGRKHTEDEKRRISETQKGRTFSQEHKAKISAAKKGTVLSEETKKKMSAKRKGRKFTDEHKAKIAEARKAYWAKIPPEQRKQTEEHAAKRAKTRLDNYYKNKAEKTKQETVQTVLNF